MLCSRLALAILRDETELALGTKGLNVEKLTGIEKNKLKWCRHLKRMEKGRLPQRILNLKVQGK